LNKPLEAIKLAANFKLDDSSTSVEPLFQTFINVISELLSFAHKNHIPALKGLRQINTAKLRRKHPRVPSHYIYTACQMAYSIYKSFRKLKRRRKVRRNMPVFKLNS